MKRIIFSVENDLHRLFKKQCVDRGDSMTNILVRLIKEETGYTEPHTYENYKEVLTDD